MTVQELSRRGSAEAMPARRKPPHYTDVLPFAESRKPLGSGIDHWTATGTGEQTADHDHGRKLGMAYLDYIGDYPTNGSVTLLGCIVDGMCERARKEDRGLTGVEYGFLRVVNEYAMSEARLMTGRQPDAEIHDLYSKWRAAYDEALVADEQQSDAAFKDLLAYEGALAKLTPVTAKGFAMKLIVMSSFEDFNLDNDDAKSLFDDAFTLTGDLPPANTEAGKRMGVQQ